MAKSKRIVVVGAGAVGGYTGGHMARNGIDVTFVDPWPEQVEAIRAGRLELDGMTREERFTVTKAKAMHLTEVQSFASAPIDVAFVAMKSYDTAWATALVAPYLAPQGFVVSLQNCLNEETIAGIVGWGRTVGIVASLISVDLYEVGRIRRTVAKGGDQHTVFRVGEPHGRVTPRVEELVDWLRGIDSAKATTNLWGERWTKLVQNAMNNPITSASGLSTPACLCDPAIRRFSLRVAGEGIRVGQALGYQLEKIRGLEAEVLARAAEGDRQALEVVERALVPRPGSNPRADLQRPSMAQDILKRRRTEIDFMNGFIARKGAEAGIATPANEKITGLVTAFTRSACARAKSRVHQVLRMSSSSPVAA